MPLTCGRCSVRINWGQGDVVWQWTLYQGCSSINLSGVADAHQVVGGKWTSNGGIGDVDGKRKSVYGGEGEEGE